MDIATAATNKAHTVSDRLMHSLQGMVDDAEALLKTAQRSGSAQFLAARDTFETRVHQARNELSDMQDAASYQARRAARAADTTVHQHPYATAGLAVGVGVLIGMLLSRR